MKKLCYVETFPAPYFCEDQELLLRCYRDSRFETVDEVLFAYRIRSIINPKKLTKTHFTVLKLQLRYFASHSEWKYMLFSGIAFFGRLHKDLSRKLQETFPLTGYGVIDESGAFKWKTTLDRLQSNASRPAK